MKKTFPQLSEIKSEKSEWPEWEPEWLVGKHDWRDGNRCVICDLERAFLGDDGPPGYDVEGLGFQDAPAPCLPRLVRQVRGFLTTKEVCAELRITPATFAHRRHQRRIRPAGVLCTRNVYLWRTDHLEQLRLSNDEWDKWSDIGNELRANLRRHACVSFPDEMVALKELVKERGFGPACGAMGLSKEIIESIFVRRLT